MRCVVLLSAYISSRKMDFRERYKRLGFDPDANRALRSHRRDEARRGIRDEQMSLRREMGSNDSLVDEDTTANIQQSTFSSSSQDSASYRTADSHNDQHSKTSVSGLYLIVAREKKNECVARCRLEIVMCLL